MSKVIELGKDNFQVSASNGITLVDFFAPWCGPCRSMAPVLEELCYEVSENVTIAKVDTDKEMSLADQFSIRSLPTIIFFKDGKIVEQMVGAKSKEELLLKLETIERGINDNEDQEYDDI